MKQKYYLYTDASPEGPYTIDELKEREITKYTPIWYEGMDDWLPAHQIEELEPLWSYEERSSFVHYPAAPPAFDKAGYEKKIETERLNVKESWTSNSLIWIATVLIVVIAVGWWGYNRSLQRANEMALAAAKEDQERWEDSTNKLVKDEQGMLTQFSTVDTFTDRTENAKNYSRMNIERLVRCTKSFERKRFGGIENASVTFFNGSDFPITRVEIHARYVKANGELHDEKVIVIDDIAPHKSKTKALADEKRGVELQCELAKIISTELGVTKNVAVSF
jgi:hypothetical protein